MALIVVLLFAAPAAARQLSASLVSIDITPADAIALAGYSERHLGLDFFKPHPHTNWLKPSKGVLDPILARVLYLKNDEKRLLFIAVDLVGSDRRMRSELVKRLSTLGFKDDDVVLSASHTHSGPGAYGRNWFFSIVATDSYIHSIYRHIVDRIVQAVVQANATLAPASLSAYAFDAIDLQKNRRSLSTAFDQSANILLVKAADGAWAGGLVNLAIHGTALTAKNLRFSADVMGAMRTKFEDRLAAANPDPASPRPLILFLNGAEGDVAPKKDEEAGMTTIGDSFAAQAMAALPSASAVAPDWSVAQVRVKLRYGRFNLKGCGVSPWIRWLVSVPNFLIGTAFPRSTRVWAIQLGGHLMLTWPGEPITTLGAALKQVGADHGATATWILGLTNDHLSYFVDAATYGVEVYESCASLYGRFAGEKIIDAHRTLVAGLP